MLAADDRTAAEVQADLDYRMPLGRRMQPEELVGAAVYLAESGGGGGYGAFVAGGWGVDGFVIWGLGWGGGVVLWRGFTPTLTLPLRGRGLI